MKLITEDRGLLLDDLLNRVSIELEITQSQRESAVTSYNAVGEWLAGEESPLAQLDPNIYAQGSLRLDTTVKPKGQDEFDLDLVCEFSKNKLNMDPLSTLKLIENRVKEHGKYANMVEVKNRCIRLNYVGQYHMDILPAYPDVSLAPGCLLVPDREAANWKQSAPKNYAEWFESCCRTECLLEKAAKIEPFPDYDLTENKPTLKRMVQLMKRYRDIKYSECKDNAPISVVITTLAGLHYCGEYSVSKGIASVLNSIKFVIPKDTTRLVVLNPVNNLEDFSEKWDIHPKRYKEFLCWIDEFIKEWSDLTVEQNNIRLADKLKNMFGETVVITAVEKQAAYIGHLRESGYLKATSALGMLNGTGIIIPKNTFYGK